MRGQGPPRGPRLPAASAAGGAEAAPAGLAEAACLVPPGEGYRDSFLAGAAEFEAEGRLDSTYAPFLGYDRRRLERDFAAFVRALQGMAHPSRLRQAGYRDHVFWLVCGPHYVGQTSIRPELGTPYLITYGGHIGYSIRPSRRRQGFGRRILALALDECAGLGLERALVTCDEDNLASRRIIEANGGRFESALVMDAAVRRAEGRAAGEGPVRKLRYWIDLVGRKEP